MSYLCPACKSKLLFGGSAIYQTSSEHVERPNHEPPLRPFYYCDNNLCDANSPEETLTRHVITEKVQKTKPNSLALFWDDSGALYGRMDGIKFIDGNEAPFGSFERKFNVEHRKRDENGTIFKWLGIRIDVEYRYESNEDGKILSKKRNFMVWKKNNLGYTYVHRPFSQLRFYNRQFNNNITNFRKNDSIYSGRQLNDIIRRSSRYEHSMSSRVFSFYVKVLYPRLIKKLRDPKYLMNT